MQFAAFHMSGAEGLLCCGDRGSLSGGISVVKESLCAQSESQCGFCEQRDPASTCGGARIIPFVIVFATAVATKWSFLASPNGRQGTY